MKTENKLRQVLINLAVTSAQSSGHVSGTLYEYVQRAETEIKHAVAEIKARVSAKYADDYEKGHAAGWNDCLEELISKLGI